MAHSKDPRFVGETEIKGDLSVMYDADFGNGDGQFDGTVYVDTITSATANTSLTFDTSLNLKRFQTLPELPLTGYTQLYANDSNGHIYSRDSSGTVFDLTDTGSASSATTVFGSLYDFYQDLPVVSTTSLNFIPRFSYTSPVLTSGKYRISLSFDYNMTDPGINFQVNLTLDGNIVDTFTKTPITTGSFTTQTFLETVTFSTSSTHTLTLNTKIQSQIRALLTKNIKLEMWRVA